MKQCQENPWQKFADEYKPGSTLEGEITAINEYGVFVKAPGGIEGLVNKSNLSDDRNVPFEEAIKSYNVGDKINVFVVDVNVDRSRVAFSVREFKKKQQRDELSQYMSSVNDDDEGAFTLGDLMNQKKENK